MQVPFEVSGSYGTQIALYNGSEEDLELCGAEADVDESWRGFKAGSVIFFPLDPKETIFVVNNGAGAAEVDWLVSQ